MGSYVCVSKQEIGTCTYVHNYVVWFYMFIKCQCLPYQLWNVFFFFKKRRRKYHTNDSCYWKHMVEERSVWLLRKLSEFYTVETVNSLFHLCGRDKYHNRVDVAVLFASTVDVDEDSVALYLGYYEWGYSCRSHGLDLWIILFWSSTFVYGHVSYVTPLYSHFFDI
jgi:hypothetical protein